MQPASARLEQESARSVLVQSRERQAEGVVSLLLAAADEHELPAWRPGAHIDLELPSGLIRQYSLCGDPADRFTYRIAVLRETNGRGGSREVHEGVGRGAELRIVGPRNHFQLQPADNYLFIAGGIGITPILPMVHEVADKGVPWKLIYGGRTADSMAFVRELPAGDIQLIPQDELGHPDLDRILEPPAIPTAIYSCGPRGLLDAIEERYAAKWPPGCLNVERFAPRELEHTVDLPFEVELRQTGVTCHVPAERSLLDVVLEAGAMPLHSCTEGTCGTCLTRVIEGEPDHRDSLLTAEERDAGDRMFICVSRAKGPRLVLDL